MGWLTSLTSFFVNPALVLPGLALVSSPIIIHLINRMRYRRVRFAAMEFLLASSKRNRRRVLIEQMILLLLRILLVLLIMFLLARLVLNPDTMSLFRGAKTHHMVVLDDSGSMREIIGEGSAFREAVSVVQKLIDEGKQRPDSQKLTLVLLSNPAEPLVNQENINDELATRLETRLENINCTHQHFNLTNGLAVAGKLFANDTESIKHLHVISDFRQNDWSDKDAIEKRMAELKAGEVAVNLVKVVPKQNNNVAITLLEGNLRVAAAGVPITFTVGVTNFGDTVIEAKSVSVSVDGIQINKSVEFAEIEPGEEQAQTLEVAFNSSGRHAIKVSLDVDALSHDNERFLVFDLPDTLPVLIVDGNPGSDGARNLADALEAGQFAYVPQVVDASFLRKSPLDPFRTIYMLNVPTMQPDALDRLQEYVAGGGGLVWFVGNLVEDDFYFTDLHKNENRYGLDKIGLFPVPLAETPDDLDHPEFRDLAADVAFESTSIFANFKDFFRSSFFDVIRIDKFYPPAENWSSDDEIRKDGVRTLAQLRNGKPFCLEHQYGKGTVVTFLTGIDDEWNNWTRDPAGLSFIVAIHDMQKLISSEVGELKQYTVGTPIHRELSLSSYSKTVEIVAPGMPPVAIEASPPGLATTDDEASLNGSADPAAGDDAKTADTKTDEKTADQDVPKPESSGRSDIYIADFADTDTPGVYSVKLTTVDRETEETLYAFNVPTEESALKLATTDEIRGTLGDESAAQIQEPGNFTWLQGKEADQEIRRFILALLMLFLLAEQLLSYKLSYHPKPGSDA